MDTLLLWTAGCLLIYILIRFIRFARRREAELEQNFQARFAGEEIIHMDKQVQIMAQQSRGFSQASGLGRLVLTPRELYFTMQLMNREIAIPVSSLKSVGETRRMGGKGTIRPMLKIVFSTPDGEEDAIALIVKDRERWQAEIAGIMAER